jgi:succinate dehydrogenase/fumarate reductase cytochrome b subunit
VTRGETSKGWYNRVFALLVVGLGWIFFRAKTVGAAFHMLASLRHFEWRYQYGPEILFLAAVSGIMLAIDFRLEVSREEYVFQRGALALPVAASLAMAAVMIAFAASETSAFIYFQF